MGYTIGYTTRVPAGQPGIVMATHRLNFTARALTDLPLCDGGRETYKDHGGKTSVAGLYLIIGGQSRMFYFSGKVNGRAVRYRLGPFPAVSVEAARKRAKELIAGAANGVDPNAEKRRLRQRGMTLGESFELYIAHITTRARKPARESTVGNYRRSVKTHFNQWVSSPATGPNGLTFESVEAWYKRAAKESPTSANSALRVGRAVYHHHGAIARRRGSDSFAVNPFVGHELVEERPRSARIDTGELSDWFAAVSTLSNETTRDYLHLLLFTGLRRREADSLRWADVDLRRRILTVQITKNGTAHELPLSGYLHELLKRRKNSSSSEWVFQSTGSKGHITEPKKAIARIATLTGIEASPHALRRTFSNIAQFQAGVPMFVVKHLLNHAVDRRDVTATHYTTLTIDALRPYMQAISDAILKAGKQSDQPANVVQLRSVS